MGKPEGKSRRGLQDNVKMDNEEVGLGMDWIYEGWNFNSDNYLFTTDTK